MEWQSWVWRLSESRRVRKSVVGTVGLVFVWSIAWGPSVEWREQTMLDRMQPLLDRATEAVSKSPIDPKSEPSP